MEGYSTKDDVRPQLLDLIPKERGWLVTRDEERGHGASEEKKLELRLGPPGEDWTIKDDDNKNISRERDESLLSFRYFSDISSPMTNNNNSTNTNTAGAKRGFSDTIVDPKILEDSWIMNNSGTQTHKFSSSENPAGSVLSSPWSSSCYQVRNQQQQPQKQTLPVIPKESSQPCYTKVVDCQNAEKKTFSPASANTAVPNSSQKRTAPAPVVGWPPIRSFRKNLASSSSSKLSPDSQNVVPNKVASDKLVESCRKGMFVKINMDGVPIGRKVDLKAYDSYEKLSSAVDELFRGLLAAQMDPPTCGIQMKQEEEKAITGLLDGSGEYTLVYEDNEGDRMLVGDVPWHMFVSTVKRLRVLKSSELSTLRVGSKQHGKIPVEAMLK